MSKKNPLIPFRWLPASYGLSGRPFEERKAYYELDGEDLDRRLVEIAHPNQKSIDYLAAMLEVNHKYGKVAGWDYDSAKAMYANNGVVDDLIQLEIDKKHDRIEQFDYDVRKAELTLTGKELTLALLEIHHDVGMTSDYDYEVEKAKLTADDVRLALLNVDFKHGKIDKYDYQLGMATDKDGNINPYDLLELNLEHSKIDQYTHDVEAAKLDTYMTDIEKEIAFLHLEFKHGKIEKLAFVKKLATLKNEPWIGIIDNGFDPSQGISGVYFEFDWNDDWVALLRAKGYQGKSDEEVVEQWFADLCRDHAGIPFDDEPVPFNSSRHLGRRDMSSRAPW